MMYNAIVKQFINSKMHFGLIIIKFRYKITQNSKYFFLLHMELSYEGGSLWLIGLMKMMMMGFGLN